MGSRAERGQTMQDIHQEPTDKVVRAIEAGLVTGEARTRPWHTAAISGLPTNHAARACSRGPNVLQLWFAAAERGYAHGLRLTYKQEQQIGAQVRAGEQGTHVIRFGQYERDTSEPRTGAYLKIYTVFNVAQCDGIDLSHVERPNLAQHIKHVEQVLWGMAVPIHYGSAQAFYRPSTDSVHLPDRNLFRPVGDATATEAFYSTALRSTSSATPPATSADSPATSDLGSAMPPTRPRSWWRSYVRCSSWPSWGWRTGAPSCAPTARRC